MPFRPSEPLSEPESTGVEVRWLRWHDAREALLELRRRVFVEEQGLAPALIESPRDADGLHLGAFEGERLVASVAGYLFEAGAPELAAFGLPPSSGLTIQWTKRIELASHRCRGIATVLAAGIVRHAYESLRPARFFLALQGPHRALEGHYRDAFGFRRHGEVMLPGGNDAAEPTTVMAVDGEAESRALYLKTRGMVEGGRRQSPATVPSLVRFLVDGGRRALLAVETLSAENLYVAPLSLADELPRLAAQNRLHHAEQRPRLAEAPFPPAREGSRLLDVGTGTGGYLALLATEAKLAGYRLVGVEPSPHLLACARAAQPHLAFRRGTAYATGEPDASADVVTMNFVFIHLGNPDLALLELRRVLRPGGVLYVVDINDATFRGPEPVRRMVDAHRAHHEGDRTILTTLPRRAAEFGFEPARRDVTTVRNTGGAEPSFGPNELKLGRAGMWGLLSFMGQRPAIADEYRAAREHYFASECELSFDVETHVYRKGSDGGERPCEPDRGPRRAPR
ncbi:MAG TPA: class I SAM-dependent methyltransferase [Polyangiaceae bacterium]|nr:class I SAM-dependent methyltransferase [Polyangiaceae bacterium]